MKTFTATPATIKRDWRVVDATDKTLGRLATQVAHRLRGKHKPEFTPHVDTGDYIVVVNAENPRHRQQAQARFISSHGLLGNLKAINPASSWATRSASSKRRSRHVAQNPLGRACTSARLRRSGSPAHRSSPHRSISEPKPTDTSNGN
jgi:large subunit ribosomal protein L13